MKRSKRLQIVLDLAQDDEDKAAKAYEMANGLYKDDVAKFDELTSYYVDYEQEFTNPKVRIRAEEMARQRSFLSQLAEAIRQQGQVVKQRKKIADVRKGIWQKAHLKRRALADLIARLKLDEDKELSKKEEKMLDEWFLQTSGVRSSSTIFQ